MPCVYHDGQSFSALVWTFKFLKYSTQTPAYVTKDDKGYTEESVC